MPTVQLKLPHHAYDIRIEQGLLSRFGALVRAVAPHDKAAVFADANVDQSCTPTAVKSLHDAGYRVVSHAVTPGEEYKNLDHVRRLYEVLIELRLERGSPVIALGGGVIGDTVGFVASTYLRGVPFVQCPTTLLAMVDSSVGGKVGVNLPQGKNLIGSFYQPALVAIDTDTLATLPLRELRCGLAECVKHAMIRDPHRFQWLEEHIDRVMALDRDALVELVHWNVQIKADVVMADEKEAGERAHLNFGHTFGHAIENCAGYGHYHHGEGVALGMVAATRLAVNVGRIPVRVLERLTALLDRIGLPVRAPDLPATDTLMAAMQLDKKVANGRLRLILPDALGAVSIVAQTPSAAIADAWNALRS